MAADSNGIAVYLQSNREDVDVAVCLADRPALDAFCRCLRRAAELSSGKWLYGPEFDSPRDPLFGIRLQRTGDGNPGRLALEQDAALRTTLRWDGDSDYWLECAEKCESLAGGVENDLTMHNHSGHSVTVSFGSLFPQA